MSAAPPAGVVFDNDGLLLDTEDAWTRAEEALFRRHGRVFTREHKLELLGSSQAHAEAWLAEALSGDGVALHAELRRHVLEEAAAGVAPRPGALELLEALRSAGVPLGLASNSERAFVELVLGKAGLLEPGAPFAVIVSASDVAHGKPAPDVYLAACAGLGLSPGDCVALEDSPTGLAAAKAAGMATVGVPYDPEAETPGADLRASSLADDAVWRRLGLTRSRVPPR